MFTPAIRATDSSPVAGTLTGILSCCQAVSANANTTPVPSIIWGPGIAGKLSDWIPALLRDSASFRQPFLGLSSLFRDFFSGFFGHSGGLAPGSRRLLPSRPFRGL